MFNVPEDLRSIYVKEVLSILLPGIRPEFINSSLISSEEIQTDVDPAALLTARHEYLPKNDRFIHFTSLRSLHSILNERAIRLYSLDNANDPKEFAWLADQFGYRGHQLVNFRRGTGLLSMCLPSVLEREDGDTLNLWRFYGNNGHGCAIELHFNDTNWSDEYLLGEVQYSKLDMSAFLEANSLFERRHKIRVDLKSIGKVPSCLHKSHLFSSEKEVRLLRLADYPPPVQYSQRARGAYYSDFNARGELVGYWKLPLFEHSLWKPYVWITKVHIGFQYSLNQFEALEKHIQRIFRVWKNDKPDLPVPNIEHSPLGESFRA